MSRQAATTVTSVVLVLVLALAGLQAVEAHEDDSRFVRDLGWSSDQIGRTLALHWGLTLPSAPLIANVLTIEDRRCFQAGLVAFDVADDFAYDIDEPVEMEILFAAPGGTEFLLAYDGNGTAGRPSRHVALEEPGGRWARATVLLERARFANRREVGTDIAIESHWLGQQAAARLGHRAGQPPAAICGIRLTRRGSSPPPAGYGQLEITLTDGETGEPAAARVGLYDQTGRMPLPSGSSVLLRWFEELRRDVHLRPSVFWPAANRRVFYVDGTYRARVPGGSYELVAMKGPEYRLARERFQIVAGATRRLAVNLDRWADMPARGWYSGDTHIHTRRQDLVDDESVRSLIAAEDLWVASTLQMGNLERVYFRQRWGDEGRYGKGGRHLVPGQEDPRTASLGHTLSLNLKQPVRYPPRYFFFHEVAEEVHRQGGLWGYAHLHRGYFNAVRGLALDLPFGTVDFIEVLQGIPKGFWLGIDELYRALDLGVKLAPTAGSDYPYLDLPGEVRSYVRVEGEFTADRWYEGLRAGRTFVTNGPMLELDVDGHGMGAELAVARGSRVRVRARAELNPDLGRLSQLQVVVHGAVAAQAVSNEGATELVVDHELANGRSVWLAARALGEGPTGVSLLAHSAPVYLIVDDAPFWNRATVPQIVEWQLNQLDRLGENSEEVSHYVEAWEILEAEKSEWARQRPMLERRVTTARDRYAELLDRLGERSGSSR